jgi:acyl-CoA reductase-like NAD-dependent aldehyde dehydrogenase
MKRQACEHNGRLGDALIDLYVEWREECSAVHAAYARWRQASKDDRAAAFAAYSAALDREERAGDVYAAMVRRLSPAPQPA